MKPASRIQATVEILEKVAESRVPMDTAVGDYMRARRYIGAKDRAEIALRVYGIVRAYARLGWWLMRMNAEDSPRANVIAYLALAEGTPPRRFKDLFDGSKYAPAALSEAEQALTEALAGQALDHPEMPIAVRTECPPDYEERLRAYFGEDFEAEMTALQQPATLDLRVNVFLKPLEEVRAALAKDGVETEPTPHSPWGLRTKGKAYLSKTKAFHKGWIEIQDEGSQLIASICDAQPGMQVLDYCAGGGGKTLALGAAMQRKGRIVAMDIDEKRLERGRQRYRKAQIADIIEVRPLSDEKNRKWLRRQKETFDITLLDVPCSGTGTWRRNPDMRWKHYGPPLADLLQLQAQIMENAAHTVKKGGRLVYATCSLLPEENEAQVEDFLAKHQEFSVRPLNNALGGDYMRLTPARHNTDGFFAAILEKKSL